MKGAPLIRDRGLAFLARGGFAALAVRPAGLALAFLTHVALARMMGVAAYGDFIYVYVWTYFLGLVCRLGLDRSIVRFGSEYLLKADLASFRRLVESSFAIAILLGCAGAGLLSAVAAIGPAGAARESLFAGALLVPLLSAHNVYEGIAQAQKRIWQATIPEQALRQTLLGICAAVAYRLNGGNLTSLQALGAYAVAIVGTLAIDWLWYRHARPAGMAQAPRAPLRLEWLTYGGQMSVVSNLGSWIQQADVILLGMLMGTSVASLYSVASRVASLVATVGLAAITVFGPVVIEVSADPASLQRYAAWVARAMAIASLGLAVTLAALGGFILGIFGPAFREAAIPLYILLAGYAARDLFGPAFIVLSMTGGHTQTLRVLVAAAAFNLAANVALIPSFQGTGAAIATACTVVLYSFLFWLTVRRRLRLDTTFLATPGGA